jgi:putative endonuclease
MTNQRNGTLYTGVTSNLIQRVWQHREGLFEGFSFKYKTNKLVYFEQCEDMISAIAREKQIKGGSRKKKIRLIESFNPEWHDLYPEIIQ